MSGILLPLIAIRSLPLIKQLDQFEAVAGITEFETLTAMAFDYFLMKKVDVAIIEVGLGGLLDSTNVAVPSIIATSTFFIKK